VKFFHPPHLYCVTTLPSKTNTTAELPKLSQNKTRISVFWTICDKWNRRWYIVFCSLSLSVGGVAQWLGRRSLADGAPSPHHVCAPWSRRHWRRTSDMSFNVQFCTKGVVLKLQFRERCEINFAHAVKMLLLLFSYCIRIQMRRWAFCGGEMGADRTVFGIIRENIQGFLFWTTV